jgi:hypothetical protein
MMMMMMMCVRVCVCDEIPWHDTPPPHLIFVFHFWFFASDSTMFNAQPCVRQ